MSTHGFFHVALMEGFGGMLVATEMHGRILQSGLYDNTDKIHVVILGDRAQSDTLIDYIFSRHSKYEVVHYSPNLSEWEWPTLKAIKEHCKDHDDDVWYVHTKGASNCRPDVPPHIQRNLRSWRGVMCHDVMNRHYECKELLKEYDAVGPLLETTRWVPHFVGNFWWARASHIRTLLDIPNEHSSARAYAEAWIGLREGSKLKGLSELRAYDCYDFSGVYGNEGVFHGYPGATI
jgi:hypothetical protein